jgi:hypothetical protein
MYLTLSLGKETAILLGGAARVIPDLWILGTGLSGIYILGF